MDRMHDHSVSRGRVFFFPSGRLLEGRVVKPNNLILSYLNE
jgi:hypothetical protein